MTESRSKHQITIHVLSKKDWMVYRDMRLQALADAPYAFATTYSEALRRTPEEWQSLLETFHRDPHRVSYLALIDQQPVGMAACVFQESGTVILAVWVDPAHRRCGVGKSLVNFAKNWTADIGGNYLEVEVYRENTAAINFYHRLGFKPEKAKQAGSSGQGRESLILRLFL